MKEHCEGGKGGDGKEEREEGGFCQYRVHLWLDFVPFFIHCYLTTSEMDKY